MALIFGISRLREGCAFLLYVDNMETSIVVAGFPCLLENPGKS